MKRLKGMEKLYSHQIKFLKENPRKRLLAWDTGTSKTRTAIEWAKQNKFKRVCIICPKALKEHWRREGERWGMDSLHYFIFSKEEFKKYAGRNSWNEAIIVDEAHFFANYKSQMAKILGKFIVKNDVENILLLTATPYTSSVWSVWTLARLLGKDWPWVDFKFRYFDHINMGGRLIPVQKKGIEREVAELVKKIGDIVKIEDCADLPDRVHEIEYFKLTPEQEKAQKGLEEPNPVVKYGRMHQIESGSLKGGEYEENKTFSSYKNERIEALCKEHKKVAVICRYNLQIDCLRRELERVGKSIFVIRGDEPDRDKVCREAESVDECIVLIQAECAEGYQLPSIKLIVFASMSYSFVKWKQLVGRFVRLDKIDTRDKYVYMYLLIENGVDEMVYDSVVKNKRSFDVKIFNRAFQI